VGCAKRGSITGGLKDTIPPALENSIPDNFSTGFKGKVIKLTFDEYVKLKDVNKQLIISPPMKTPPVITPTVASKQFTINIKDTLKPNTTYSFNFGQSVQDNNENNPLPQFKYVFSTGEYIDSLSLKGSFKDAYSRKMDNFVSVMLYEINDSYTDSTIYKQTPRYITNTLDTLKVWKLDNLKPGKYLLVALKDNGNNKYDPKSDKIGFHKEYVTIPTDSTYQLKLFKEEIPFRALKPSLDAGQKLVMGYQGKPDGIKVVLKNGNDILPSVVTKVQDKDSVNIWYRPIKADSLGVTVSKGDYTKEFFAKIKTQKKDTLNFKPMITGTLPLRDKFSIQASKPLASFDQTKMSIIRKDSSNVPFTIAYDEYHRTLKFDFAKDPAQKYTIRLLPGAVTDFYDKVNDTLKYKLSTKNLEDYGNLHVTLENAKRFPIIVQLTNAKGEVQASEYTEKASVIDFNMMEPATYRLRIIYDDNKNKEWDSGNFIQKRQPEEVIYFQEPIVLRANWFIDQPFVLP
jgi:uncharacterized protein (DUF2141 family)